jgi:hypothetical protein
MDVLTYDKTVNVQTKLFPGRAMAQAVSRRPLTAEARVRFRVSPCESKRHWGRFFSELSVFPCQFHSTGAPLLVKLGKKHCSSSQGLHKMPKGCGASVVSAAGPPHHAKKNTSIDTCNFLYNIRVAWRIFNISSKTNLQNLENGKIKFNF